MIWATIKPEVGNAGSIMEGLGDLLQPDRAICGSVYSFATLR